MCSVLENGPFFSVAKDARNSPDVQACSPVQRFLRGWFCGIASTNSSHTIPANLTPGDGTVEKPLRHCHCSATPSQDFHTRMVLRYSWQLTGASLSGGFWCR